MTRKLIVGALAAASIFAFAAPSMGDTVRVRAAGEPGTFRWMPAERHANRGDRVVWRNPTDATHTVTAYSRNWDKNTTIRSGERTSKRFRRTGVYLYRCMRPGHSALANGECTGMCGKIHVM